MHHIFQPLSSITRLKKAFVLKKTKIAEAMKYSSIHVDICFRFHNLIISIVLNILDERAQPAFNLPSNALLSLSSTNAVRFLYVTYPIKNSNMKRLVRHSSPSGPTSLWTAACLLGFIEAERCLCRCWSLSAIIT